MVVKLTQTQAEFLGTFGSLEDEHNKRKALYHITRFGWGYNLTDGDDCESRAFESIRSCIPVHFPRRRSIQES